jgi:hypothetical protein
VLLALFEVVTEARLKALLTREELFLAIRRERQRDNTLSGRALARKFRVSTRTVAAALASPVPPAADSGHRKIHIRGHHDPHGRPDQSRTGGRHVLSVTAA